MLSNVSGLSIGLGLTLGLSTACSQAHGSDAARNDNGIHLRRCLVALCVAMIGLVAVAVFAEPILLGVGQPAAVALASARFCQVQALGVPFFWVASALATVCDSVQQTKPGMYSQVVASIVQLAVTAVLVAGLRVGYLGMAAGRSFGGVLQLVLIVVLVYRSPSLGERVWGRRLSWRVLRSRVLNFSSVYEYVVLALPSAIVWWIEWWSFEGLTVLVGLLPNPTITLAAHGIIFNTVVTMYQLFQGIGIALCAVTGMRVGEGKGRDVPGFIGLSVLSALVLSAIVCSGLYFFRRDVALAFDPREEVADVVDRNMLGAVVSLPGYAMLMTIAGACRGANRQRWVAAGTVSGYAGGIPLAWYLGYRREWPHPLMGVWLGNAAALAWAALCAAVVVLLIRWDLVEKVRVRAGRGSVRRLSTANIYEDNDVNDNDDDGDDATAGFAKVEMQTHADNSEVARLLDATTLRR
jgi:MATE family multidrug resistance protein